MNTLILKNHALVNYTTIDNEFIDTYMVKANGDFVKVYLFLLRHLNSPTGLLTITKIADCLEYTEKDILRALKYWEKTALISIEYDTNKKITGLAFNGITPPLSTTKEVSVQMEKPSSPQASLDIAEPAPAKNKTLVNRKELKQLLFVAEQYLGKTLTRTDIDMIYYFHDSLGFHSDLIEYLIEYCVENGHKSMHYIQSVAIAWSDNHVTSIDDARESSAIYNKNCYTVLKAFGISGRGPASSEKEFIDKWINKYAFTLDIIKEACDRTMSSIHQPSFEYADSILSNWLSQSVHHLSDIESLDITYKQEKENKKKSNSKPVANNKFNNFQSRTYDMGSLEEQLLNTK